MKKDKNIIDDGFRPEFVENADFAGVFELPVIEAPKEIIVPQGMIPFTKREYSDNFKEAVVFYEHDIRFRDILTATNEYIEDLKRFPAVVTPDCSLYRDMPLVLQITNTYLSRQIGVKFQSEGIYTIPNVRWGDERSYTTILFPEPFAFIGIPKNSIVSIGTYGCIRGRENKQHFKAGLEAMITFLEPQVVLVYGPMPEDIFGPYLGKTRFIQFDDWTKIKKKEAADLRDFASRLRDIPIIEDGEIVGYETYLEK